MAFDLVAHRRYVTLQSTGSCMLLARARVCLSVLNVYPVEGATTWPSKLVEQKSSEGKASPSEWIFVCDAFGWPRTRIEHTFNYS